MNTIRSTAVSAGMFALTTLGCLSLAACSIPTVIGSGSGGSGGSGGSSSSSSSTGAGGSGGPAQVIYSAAGTDLNPWGITVDATNVYITDAQGPHGKVVRVPLDGSPTSDLAIDQDLPSAIVVDATDAYFMAAKSVMKVPLAGGPAVQVSPAEDAGYASMAIDGTNVYWTNYTFMGSTMLLPKAGGPAVALDTGDEYPSGIALQGGSVYWAAFENDEIKSAPIAGGSVNVIATGQNKPRSGLAADATNIYWITEGDFPNHLVKAPLAGGPAVQIAVSPSQASTPQSLVVDATYAFFIDADCGIVKVELATGAVTTIPLDSTVGCPMFLAADATALYYTSRVGVSKVVK